MTDKELIKIMIALTGWRFSPSLIDMEQICTSSPPNWYAYMGLMETYKFKYLDTNQRYINFDN